METLFNLFLWGIVEALALGTLGVIAAIVVRATAYYGQQTAATSFRAALGDAWFSAGLFGAVLGFLCGSVRAYSDPSLEQGMADLGTLTGLAVALLASATLLAWLALHWIWLGVRYTGPLLSAVISSGLAGLTAWRKFGVSAEWTITGVVILSLIAVAVVTFLRLRTPPAYRPLPADLDEC